MYIYIAADHRGFSLKSDLLHYLVSKKYVVKDVGNIKHDMHDDYTDFVFSLSENMTSDADRGIVICGSGVGVCVAANRYPHIRCALGFDSQQIMNARQEDNVNVLSLAADFISLEMAKNYTDTFLSAQFKNEEKYIRRLKKLNEYSHGNCSGCSCHR